jgi:hypothetical protein
MSLQILVAGVEKDAKARVMSTIKSAFGRRADIEDWTVSLVRIGLQWSVTLSGTDERFKNVSFMTDEGRLGERISATLDGRMDESASDPLFAPLPTMPPRMDAKDRHLCESCQQGFVVVFESQPGEALVSTAVACPHCWHINHVQIGAWAASGHDFRAEKA